MSVNTKVQPPPEVQDTRIITLLESNDVSFSPVDGQWSNNLNENTVLREGDSLTVRQSMIDTTSESIGLIDVKSEDSVVKVKAGEAYIAKKGVEVQYSTPGTEGAEYIAVCLPAFSPQSVHRDEN